MTPTATTQIVIATASNVVTHVSLVCSCNPDPLLISWSVDKDLKLAALIDRRDQHVAINHPKYLGQGNNTPTAVVVDETGRDRRSTFHVIEMTPETYNERVTRYVNSKEFAIRGAFKHQGSECGWKILHSTEGGQTHVYLVPLATIIDRGQIPAEERRKIRIADGDTLVIRNEAYVIHDDVRMANPRLARA